MSPIGFPPVDKRAEIGATPVLGLAGEGLGNSLAFRLSFDDQTPLDFAVENARVLVRILRGKWIAFV
jgi:hypothetical protein